MATVLDQAWADRRLAFIPPGYRSSAFWPERPTALFLGVSEPELDALIKRWNVSTVEWASGRLVSVVDLWNSLWDLQQPPDDIAILSAWPVAPPRSVSGG